eukprot:2829908-Amphidinium_carterae.1
MDLRARESQLVLRFAEEFACARTEFRSCGQCVGPVLSLEKIPREAGRCQSICQQTPCTCKGSVATNYPGALFAGTWSFRTVGVIQLSKH